MKPYITLCLLLIYLSNTQPAPANYSGDGTKEELDGPSEKMLNKILDEVKKYFEQKIEEIKCDLELKYERLYGNLNNDTAKNDSEKVGGKYTMKYDVTTDSPFDLSTVITNSWENLTNYVYNTTESNLPGYTTENVNTTTCDDQSTINSNSSTDFLNTNVTTVSSITDATNLETENETTEYTEITSNITTLGNFATTATETSTTNHRKSTDILKSTPNDFTVTVSCTMNATIEGTSQNTPEGSTWNILTTTEGLNCTTIVMAKQTQTLDDEISKVTSAQELSSATACSTDLLTNTSTSTYIDDTATIESVENSTSSEGYIPIKASSYSKIVESGSEKQPRDTTTSLSTFTSCTEDSITSESVDEISKSKSLTESTTCFSTNTENNTDQITIANNTVFTLREIEFPTENVTDKIGTEALTKTTTDMVGITGSITEEIINEFNTTPVIQNTATTSCSTAEESTTEIPTSIHGFPSSTTNSVTASTLLDLATSEISLTGVTENQTITTLCSTVGDTATEFMNTVTNFEESPEATTEMFSNNTNDDINKLMSSELITSGNPLAENQTSSFKVLLTTTPCTVSEDSTTDNSTKYYLTSTLENTEFTSSDLCETTSFMIANNTGTNIYDPKHWTTLATTETSIPMTDSNGTSLTSLDLEQTLPKSTIASLSTNEGNDTSTVSTNTINNVELTTSISCTNSSNISTESEQSTIFPEIKDSKVLNCSDMLKSNKEKFVQELFIPVIHIPENKTAGYCGYFKKFLDCLNS